MPQSIIDDKCAEFTLAVGYMKLKTTLEHLSSEIKKDQKKIEEKVGELLENIFLMLQTKEIHKILDFTYDRILSWIEEGDSIACNLLFEDPSLNNNFTAKNVTLILGLLTITGPIRKYLPARKTFFQKFVKNLHEKGRSADEIRSLLTGLD